jgi:hypothetical protein
MSDKRFKTNVEPIHNSLSKIINLNGVYYNYIENDRFEFPKGKTIGFIAQEVEKILPELVSIDEDGYRGVKYELVTAVLVEAIKEQQTLIETLQKNNTEKDIQFNKLTTEVEELKSLKKELAEIKKLLKDQQFKAVK